jgi:CRISPR-associated exonuclease Cas4
MIVTGTHINYYFICHRKLWLFSNNVQMEQNSDTVYEGKMIHEDSYSQRSMKYEEVAIDGIKVDYYSAKDKVIHEIKKSSKLHHTHLWQLKYYIYVFEQNGIEGVTGLLEYPRERKTDEVFLSDPDRDRIRELLQEIPVIINNDCPNLLHKPICKNCSYYDFCYADELP